jgi:hypothetical protein
LKAASNPSLSKDYTDNAKIMLWLKKLSPHHFQIPQSPYIQQAEPSAAGQKTRF